MSKAFRNNYLLLGISILSLVAGLVLAAQKQQAASVFSYAVGAAIGLGLSILLLIRAIKNGEFGSDVLALISITATALTNEWLAASVITVMLATGRALERWAEGRARKQLEALLKRAPQFAHLIDSDGQIRDVALNQVAIGDKLLVRSGEVVPIDGTMLTSGSFDQSALTGEPIPVFIAPGEMVQSGVLNSDNQVEILASCKAENSTYANLIRLVEQAQASSAHGVRLANKWAVRFVPFAILLALASWLISGQVSTAVAVIVAATPCPLILAVPVAIIAGMSRAAANGAIVKGGAALEALARTETVLLDKTGTLTHGGPQISEMAFEPVADPDRVLMLAASLDQSSPHVVAKALVTEAKRRGLVLKQATEVVENHGVGLSGLVGDQHVTVGQPEGQLPEWARLDSALLVAITVDRSLAGVIGLDDPLRDEAKGMVMALRRLGVQRVLLVSGDRQSTAESVGAEVGVDQVFAECKPEQKLQILKDEMHSAKGTVIAVGDGINDAPALAAATVGVAMGARGATAASEAADVVIVEDSIKHLAIAISIAKGTRARALQAAGIGMSLAMLSMFGASFGFISATQAAVIQEFIDMAAILWALVPTRIMRYSNN
jgi:heavy metal translocating P-type ATPase